MEFVRRDAPFMAPKVDVASIMRQVVFALIPAALVHAWFFGPGIFFNIAIAQCISAVPTHTLKNGG